MKPKEAEANLASISPRERINGRNKVKKKISLVLLTVLMICSCGKKQDSANPAVTPKCIDSHNITTNNLNTNMLNLTEEQMEMIFPYVKYTAYALVVVGVAALTYTVPKVYNGILSPIGTLIMKICAKIPKVRDIDFIKDRAAKPFYTPSPSVPEFPKEITISNSFEKPLYTVPCNAVGDGSLTKNAVVKPSPSE
jgi:hypothetical protein